jgi:hypothetical protein
MAYLSNQTVTIDAILTKKGRQYLSQGTFDITSFACADDDVDYTLYNPTHPSGSAFYGEAIQNLPVLEAFPDDTQCMKYKLVTLPQGTATLPVISIGLPTVSLKQGASIAIIPQTLNYLGSKTTIEPDGYLVTVGDGRLLSAFTGTGIDTSNMNASTITTIQTTNVSVSQIGTTFNLTGTTINTLFGTSGTALYSQIYIIGRNSGASIRVPLTITKTS